MQRFDSQADVHLGRFPGAEKQYHAFTEKMSGYVERERQMRGDNASNTRYQLSNAATQVSDATDRMHDQGESLESAMESDAKPLADEVTRADAICRQTASGTNELTPAEIEAHRAACGRLTIAIIPFRQRYDAMTSGLTHLEQVYSQEKKVQQGLLQAAQRLE